MSNNGYPQPDNASGGPFFEVRATPDPYGAAFDPFDIAPPVRDRYWLHALLLLLTFLSTTVVGAGLAENFKSNVPFTLDEIAGYVRMWQHPSYLLQGLPFSLTLLLILMAHEMGHYLTALYYGVDVSLPYFLPAPTLIGTLGAFIRIRSQVQTKRALFDIGIGGPLAGFVVLVGPLAAGVALSRVVPGIVIRGDLTMGNPLLLRLFEALLFPGVRPGDISLHPVARAAWAGLLATALNLLPIGQLDGGHILYAFAGERTRLLSRLFVAALASLGIYQLFATHYTNGYTWLLWAAMLFFLGMRHPAIYDRRPVGRLRTWLGVAALAMFILSFTVSPVQTNGL